MATSLGMAIAEKWLAARYNRPGSEIFNYCIYAVCGDGCMMEGIASEAASLAAHLSLDIRSRGPRKTLARFPGACIIAANEIERSQGGMCAAVAARL